MNKQGKLWGFTNKILEINNVSIHRLSIDKDQSCSKHYHMHKYNMFYVESGKLEIIVWQKNPDIIEKTILTSNEINLIKPQIYHQFKALENSIVYEIYYAKLEDEDIYREIISDVFKAEPTI